MDSQTDCYYTPDENSTFSLSRAYELYSKKWTNNNNNVTITTEDKFLNTLLIFPPLWDINLAPMLSTPMLTNMLNRCGHDAEFLDLNSDYMNFVLNKEFFNYYRDKVVYFEKQLVNISKKMQTPENNSLRIYMTELVLAFRNAETFLTDFYNNYPEANFNTDSLFDKEGSEIQEYYHICKNITMNTFINNYKINVPDDCRLLYDWEERILNTIFEKQPELIGFSVYCIEQYRWALSFSEKIKQRIKTKIFFGGNQLTSLRYEIDKNIFNKCVDVCIYGNGEIPLCMLADGEEYENIPNLIYLDKDNNLKINSDYKKRFDFYGAKYDSVNFKDYFVPNPVLPVEGSRGCYWGKCEFCDFMDCMTYRQKKVDDLLDEIEEYINKYNVHHFFFTDAAMHPEYAKEFSSKVLEKNLKLYFLSDFRFEKEFDEELLNLMYDAGLRVALWGLESGSDRILQMYNKGTTVENNSRVIKLASQAGIFNWCWTMILFPMETAEEMVMTRNFLFDHYDFIDYVSLHNFTLLKNSPITMNYKNFGMTSGNFFKPNLGMRIFSEKIRHEIFNLYMPKMCKNPDDLTNMLLKCSREKP